MWTVNICSSIAARGEPTAIQIKNKPREKLLTRQGGMTLTETERRRSQPRKYKNSVRSRAKSSEIGNHPDPDAT
jgi:hypothetical protein